MTPSAAVAPMQKQRRTMEEITSSIWIDFEEATRYSMLGHHTVRLLLHQGKIRGRRVGKKWVVSRESIDAYLNEPHQKVRVALNALRG